MRGAPEVVLRGREPERPAEERGRADVVHAVRERARLVVLGVVVVRGAELRDGGDLDALQHEARLLHAVLDRHARARRAEPHLQQPRARERRRGQRRVEPLELVVHPVLLVDDHAPLGRVLHHVVPQRL